MNQSKVHGLGPGPRDWVFLPALLGALEDAFTVGSIIQAKVQVCGDELQTIVPDFKPFLKKLDEHFDSIIDFPDREKLSSLVKELNGTSGLGIKAFQRSYDVLTGTTMNTDNMLKKLNEAKEIRKKARLAVTMRSGAIILKKQKKSEVKIFLAQASSLGVTVPGEMKKLLEALQKAEAA